ncbi:MAG: thioredoxin domain-containing protein [Elusimicrobia bacterium]|nr:thioredoxin domain-containing protein [Elusimicrobiota bacterium]
MSKSFERRLWGAAIVLTAASLSVFSVRRVVKPTAEEAPSYRQKGPPDSPVVIAEFSDFECPACRAAEPGLKNLLALYDGKVHFLFKHFPLTPRPHPWARQAAIIAECAGRQGKFWETHDLLYEHQREWADLVENPGSSGPPKDPVDALLPYARKAGAEESALRACLNDPSAAAAVDADKKEGQDRWIGSTPTFFINQRRFPGSQTFANAGTIWIDKILKNRK